MTSTSSLLLLCILYFLTLAKAQEKPPLYANYLTQKGYSPGGVYDIGNVHPYDTISIKLTWDRITNSGGSPILTLYKLYPDSDILG